MITRFATKQLSTVGREVYDWVESDDIASLIRTRTLVAEQVAQHKILLKVFDANGVCQQGTDALNLIPMLAIKYSLPNGQVWIRGVTPKKEVNYHPVASCLESLKAWQLIHQRDTDDGMITNLWYFDGHSDDWKPASLPAPVPA